MSLRERLRRARLYWRSRALFRDCLEDPGVAWTLLFAGDRSVEIRFRTGRRFAMPARHWPLLPTACRLDRIGARFEFRDEGKRIELDGLVFHTPLWTRNEADYLREVLVEDIYGAKSRDFRGKVVVDVGAYVGDASLAFARQGATVHAVEPSAACSALIRRNAEENGLAANVVVHAVGLAERAGDAAFGADRLHFVEGVDYALRHFPAHIELLKLDCEGAEYHLLADDRFLAHLAPREIRMEYHRGPEALLPKLEAAGYDVEMEPSEGSVGLLKAISRRASGPSAA